MQHAYGRRPPKNAPALRFAAIRDAVTIPNHPASYDSIFGWSDWDMLGNDTWGDCVSVTWSTIRRIVSKVHVGVDHYPGLDQVLALYKTQNPHFDPSSSIHGAGSADDQGMDIQTLLEYLVAHGGPDGTKALAFAKLDHRNPEEVRAAAAIFNFVWLGVDVSDHDERVFPGLWDVNRYDSILGGHSITMTGYDSSTFKMETWAEEGSLSLAYMSQRVEEAWVVVWPEHAANLTTDQRGALNAAFREMTGRDIDWGDTPVPTPTPGPAPAPVPVPQDPDATFVADLKEWLSHPHGSKVNVALVKAAKAWLATRTP